MNRKILTIVFGLVFLLTPVVYAKSKEFSSKSSIGKTSNPLGVSVKSSGSGQPKGLKKTNSNIKTGSGLSTKSPGLATSSKPGKKKP